jgi:hypothetical protein
MANNSLEEPVARILYKEIVQGDRRKIQAQSNDSDSGGGARDFRFGSYNQLLPILKFMFPEVVREKRKRGKIVDEIEVFKGVFYWQNSIDGLIEKDSFFEPPTDVRPSEGRIVRVHEYGCFNTSLIPDAYSGNRILLLLIQRTDGKVWPHFAEERTLRTPDVWDSSVARELLKCLDTSRSAGRAVIGYYDFTTNSRYCNGK